MKNIRFVISIALTAILAAFLHAQTTRLVFLEDFGGNEATDPAVSPSGTPGVVNYRYNNKSESYSGYYSVRKSRYHGSWHYMDDHTIEGDRERGYLMYVDADDKEVFYIKDLDIGCSRDLTFGVWAINVNTYQQTYDNWAKPILEFKVTDYYTGDTLILKQTGEIHVDKVNVSASESATWIHYTAKGTIPKGVNKIHFEMLTKQHAYLGGDFAVDDIEIYVDEPDNFVLSDIDACSNEELTIKAPDIDYKSWFGDDIYYTWEKLSDDGTSWTTVGYDKDLALGKPDATMNGKYRMSANCSTDLFCIAHSDTMTLKVIETKDSTINEKICRGETYSFNGQNITEKGVYTYKTKSIITGCDSTVTLNMDVIEPKDSTINEKICRGETYSFNGQDITESGVYTYKTKSLITGCDSIVTLNMSVIEPKDSTIDERMCKGETYSFNGQEITESGVYTYKTKSLITGCDSIVTLNMDVIEPKDSTIDERMCQGETYSFNGQNITESGVYTYTTKSLVTGCDSIVTLNMDVIEPDETEITMLMPQDSFYEWEGDVYRQPGTYKKMLKNQFGCDSLVVLTLDANPTVHVNIPEGFSPNDDGINDTFVIQGIENYADNRIRIFNRWGNKVYEASPYRNNWDGRNHEGGNVGSDKLPVGTYYYLLWLRKNDSPKKGYIYLNR
jgi:gliding motility-associated-like protein